MKSILILFFFLFSGMVFSQKKESIKMTRAQLSKINLFSDLAKIQAQNPKVISFEVVAKVNGKLASVAGTGSDSLHAGVKNILTGADVGSKIYFDILIDPKKPKSIQTNIQTFAILVTE